MTCCNISGPDLKPGHHIYMVHYASQPTDSNCVLLTKNDEKVMIFLHNTKSYLGLLLLSKHKLSCCCFNRFLTQDMILIPQKARWKGVWSQVCAGWSCSSSLVFLTVWVRCQVIIPHLGLSKQPHPIFEENVSEIM